MPDVFQVVRRVYTDGGGHIEPPLDQQWTPLRKLLWHAAVVEVDTGLKVEVKEQVSDLFAVSLSNSTSGLFDFSTAWTFITGAGYGAYAARRGGGA